MLFFFVSFSFFPCLHLTLYTIRVGSCPFLLNIRYLDCPPDVTDRDKSQSCSWLGTEGGYFLCAGKAKQLILKKENACMTQAPTHSPTGSPSHVPTPLPTTAPIKRLHPTRSPSNKSPTQSVTHLRIHLRILLRRNLLMHRLSLLLTQWRMHPLMHPHGRGPTVPTYLLS